MRSTTGLTVFALAAGLLSMSGGPATADTAVPLPLTSFTGLLVDQANAKVYVAGGSLVVSGFDGTTTTVPGVAQARQLAFSDDGSELVVSAGDGLVIIDPTTSTVDRSIATGADTCPDAVAPASGLVFFTYGDCAGGSPGLGAVDLATDTVTTGLDIGTATPTDAQLVGIPGSGANLIAGRFGQTMVALDTTGGDTPAVVVRTREVGGGFADIAWSGSYQAVTASPALSNHRTFGVRDPDMRPGQSIESGSTPTAAAVRQNDEMLATANQGVVRVYLRPGSYLVRSPIVFPTGTTVPPRGLAFGTYRLYAVTHNANDGSYVLRKIDNGVHVNLRVEVSQVLIKYGAAVKVTARLPAGPSSRVVSIWAYPVGKARRLVTTAPVSSMGNLTVTVPYLTRNTTFEATHAGDEFHAPSSARAAVKVRSRIILSTTSTSMWSSYHKLHAKPTPLITGVVQPTHAAQCVAVSGAIKVGASWVGLQHLPCVRTTSSSRFSLKLTGFAPGDLVRVQASIKSDTVNYASPTATYYIKFT